MKRKKTLRQKAKAKLDKIFSEYIRRRFADEYGRVECFTCGKVDHWKNLQAGHFMSRAKMPTRWNEDNVQVQCAGCNIFRHGEQFKFGQKLGADKAEELQIKSIQTVKYNLAYITNKIKEYKSKCDEL